MTGRRGTPWDEHRLTNVGAGAGVFKRKTAGALELRTITGGVGITVTENANEITLDTGGGGGGTFDPNYTVADGIRQSPWIPELRRMVVARRNSGLMVFVDPVLKTTEERTAHGATTDATPTCAYDPTNFQLFVSNYINGGGTKVHVLDLTTLQRIAEITVGTGPLGIAWCPTNDCIYVVNVFSNSVSVISTSSLTVVATVTVGTLPIGICYCPSNDSMYVGNRTSNSVSVIACSSNTVTATITSMGAADCPFYVPSSDEVIVTATTANVHKWINPSTNVATSLTTNGFSNCRGGTYVPPTDEYWMAAGNGRFEVYDAATNNAVTTITTAGVGAPAYCPITEQVIYRDEGESYWAIIDPATRNIAYMGF
jgi:YVTN family beta-propeller protein